MSTASFVSKEFFKRVRALISNHVVLAERIGIKSAIEQGVPRHRALQLTHKALSQFIRGSSGVSPRRAENKELGSTLKITPELAKDRQVLIKEFDKIAPKSFKRERFMQLRRGGEAGGQEIKKIREEVEIEAGIVRLKEAGEDFGASIEKIKKLAIKKGDFKTLRKIKDTKLDEPLLPEDRDVLDEVIRQTGKVEDIVHGDKFIQEGVKRKLKRIFNKPVNAEILPFPEM